METRLAARFSRWRRYRQMVRELRDFSNHELSELGFARQDIERIAYKAVYR